MEFNNLINYKQEFKEALSARVKSLFEDRMLPKDSDFAKTLGDADSRISNALSVARRNRLKQKQEKLGYGSKPEINKSAMIRSFSNNKSSDTSPEIENIDVSNLPPRAVDKIVAVNPNIAKNVKGKSSISFKPEDDEAKKQREKRDASDAQSARIAGAARQQSDEDKQTAADFLQNRKFFKTQGVSDEQARTASKILADASKKGYAVSQKALGSALGRKKLTPEQREMLEKEYKDMLDEKPSSSNTGYEDEWNVKEVPSKTFVDGFQDKSITRARLYRTKVRNTGKDGINKISIQHVSPINFGAFEGDYEDYSDKVREQSQNKQTVDNIKKELSKGLDKDNYNRVLTLVPDDVSDEDWKKQVDSVRTSMLNQKAREVRKKLVQHNLNRMGISQPTNNDKQPDEQKTPAENIQDETPKKEKKHGKLLKITVDKPEQQTQQSSGSRRRATMASSESDDEKQTTPDNKKEKTWQDEYKRKNIVGSGPAAFELSQLYPNSKVTETEFKTYRKQQDKAGNNVTLVPSSKREIVNGKSKNVKPGRNEYGKGYSVMEKLLPRYIGSILSEIKMNLFEGRHNLEKINRATKALEQAGVKNAYGVASNVINKATQERISKFNDPEAVYKNEVDTVLSQRGATGENLANHEGEARKKTDVSGQELASRIQYPNDQAEHIKRQQGQKQAERGWMNKFKNKFEYEAMRQRREFYKKHENKYKNKKELMNAADKEFGKNNSKIISQLYLSQPKLNKRKINENIGSILSEIKNKPIYTNFIKPEVERPYNDTPEQGKINYEDEIEYGNDQDFVDSLNRVKKGESASVTKRTPSGTITISNKKTPAHSETHYKKVELHPDLTKEKIKADVKKLYGRIKNGEYDGYPSFEKIKRNQLKKWVDSLNHIQKLERERYQKGEEIRAGATDRALAHRTINDGQSFRKTSGMADEKVAIEKQKARERREDRNEKKISEKSSSGLRAVLSGKSTYNRNKRKQ